jgi:hypothetical protein
VAGITSELVTTFAAAGSCRCAHDVQPANIAAADGAMTAAAAQRERAPRRSLVIVHLLLAVAVVVVVLIVVGRVLM